MSSGSLPGVQSSSAIRTIIRAQHDSRDHVVLYLSHPERPRILYTCTKQRFVNRNRRVNVCKRQRNRTSAASRSTRRIRSRFGQPSSANLPVTVARAKSNVHLSKRFRRVPKSKFTEEVSTRNTIVPVVKRHRRAQNEAHEERS